MSSEAVSLRTTVIGSFPKPPYLQIPDFFAKGAQKPGLLGTNTDAYTQMMAGLDKDGLDKLEGYIMKATKEVIQEQVDCGVEEVTDGEVRRENYIHYFCRFVEGIDFQNKTEIQARNGAFTAQVPTINAEGKWRGPMSCADEWKKAQAVSSVPVKYTLPGPMTIMGSTANSHYKDDRHLATDLAKIINVHVLELAEAGCKYIQVDEPLFARKPDEALAYGIDCLDLCFKGCPADVETQMHMCCGYPGHVDQTEYLKADPQSYRRIAPKLDASTVDAVSIEDAWCRNDLSLLGLFKKTKVILGTMNVSSSRVETVEEMQARLTEALEHIDAERLIVAPDCGLALLDGEKYRPLLNVKLANMCKAAKCVPCTKKRKGSAIDGVSLCASYNGSPIKESRKESIMMAALT
nr:B12-independent methionine synthase 2 isoform 2 [Karenia mikimotoi]